ncbi:hypothetical protein PXC01_05830 [Maribacter sp. M208]|nr:hypothetical protein [Maribacter huludaoensis]MDF4221099.1 hypothetical protein [Maribacter huludaoensis]
MKTSQIRNPFTERSRSEILSDKVEVIKENIEKRENAMRYTPNATREA